MMEAPKIYNEKIEDTEQGVLLTFSLDEGLEPSEETYLWVRARIPGSDYYQPLDLNILSGGKTATALIEPGKVFIDSGGKSASVALEMYYEKYPEREKSKYWQKPVVFTPDWIKLPPFEHELRALFERITIEGQATEAARYKLISYEEANLKMYREAALNSEVGLWMITDSATNDSIGIAPNQPDEGFEWRKEWFKAVLARREKIIEES